MLQLEHNIEYSSKGGGKIRPSENDHPHPTYNTGQDGSNDPVKTKMPETQIPIVAVTTYWLIKAGLVDLYVLLYIFPQHVCLITLQQNLLFKSDILD